MADRDNTTPITLDAETQRAIIYALEAQFLALARIGSAFAHFEKMDTDDDDLNDLILEGAQAARNTASHVREWLGFNLFSRPDPMIHGGPSWRKIYSTFAELPHNRSAADVLRLIEGDDEGRDAA